MATKKIDVYLPEGLHLATFTISEVQDGVSPMPKKEEKKPEGKGNGNGGKRDSSLMSEAQKRYLFRLLAEEGLENEAAHEELKKRFNAKTLMEVSKVEASREIERLMASQQGGSGNGH